MVKLLAAKTITGNPTDGIDNATKALFGRIPASELELHAEGSFEPKGALKKLQGSRYGALLSGRYDGLWGIGHVKELLLVAFLSRRMKYIVNFHTIMIKGSEGRWRSQTPWFLRKFIFSRADLVISPSEFAANTVRRYFPNIRAVGILNGVDTELFNPKKKNPALLKEKYGLRVDRPIIAFVGTLQARKRPDIFINIAKRCPDAHFVAVGRKFPEYDFLAAADGLKNFQWIPAMPREDVAALLASSRAFVFPSLDEPSAAVILEAMASGAAPVLSKSGGNGEYLKDGESGFLVPPIGRETDGFIKILRMLVNDNALCAKVTSAARRAAEEHSFATVAAAYKDVILSHLV